MTKKPLPSSDALERAGLRSAAAGIDAGHPDHALLLDLAEFASKSRDFKFSHVGANDAWPLFLRICSTPAKTADGAIAKMECVLDMNPDPVVAAALPISAVRDGLRELRLEMEMRERRA